MRLPPDQFKQIIHSAPLVAVDLIIQNPEGRILIGLRRNRPAQGFWFVPGGRILKNESLLEATERIGLEEIGYGISLEQCELLGISDHIYDDNAFGDHSFNTHYVVLALVFIDRDNRISPRQNDQHDQMIFEDVENVLKRQDVHSFTKRYFDASLPGLYFRHNPEA
jgi:colanic acid biosynthesis protein WcaH